MGQFSFKYSDDNERSIKPGGGKAIMIDDKGNRWIEKNYDGYGHLGGKDFYELLADMNDLSNRSEAVDLWFSNKRFKSPKLLTMQYEKVTCIDYEEFDDPENCPYQGCVKVSGYPYKHDIW